MWKDGWMCTAGGVHSSLFFAAGAVLALLSAAPASAQLAWDPPGERGWDLSSEGARPFRVGGSLELSLFGGGVDLGFVDAEATSVTTMLDVAVLIEDLVEVGATTGFTWGEARQTFSMDDDGAAAVSPFFYGAVVFRHELFRVRGGAGFGLPLDGRAFNDALTAAYAAGVHGLEDLWLWSSNTFSVVPFVTLEAVPTQYLYLAASLHFGILIPTAGGLDTELDIQLAGEGGLRWGPLLAAIRLRAVTFPTTG